jgi:hypothetical protein
MSHMPVRQIEVEPYAVITPPASWWRAYEIAVVNTSCGRFAYGRKRAERKARRMVRRYRRKRAAIRASWEVR